MPSRIDREAKYDNAEFFQEKFCSRSLIFCSFSAFALSFSHSVATTFSGTRATKSAWTSAKMKQRDELQL